LLDQLGEARIPDDLEGFTEASSLRRERSEAVERSPQALPFFRRSAAQPTKKERRKADATR